MLTAAVLILGDKNPINYFFWFVMGFLLISGEGIQAAIDRDLPIYAVLSILGIGHRWLNTSRQALPALSKAAFPFCILHLPVSTLVGL